MLKKLKLINGNTLKIIGAVSMLIDHMGMMLFPSIIVFRIIGRLAFPLFAFMIAEGCRHTRSRLRHFLSISSLAVICQVGYSFYSSNRYLCVLVTFSISIALIYALQLFKEIIFCKSSVAMRALGAGLVFIGGVVLAYFFNKQIRVEYGFFGCMLPVFISLLQMPPSAPESLKRLDCAPVHALVATVGLILICLDSASSLQYFSLLAIPLILLYSGKRGRLNLKYFFYFFYPAHLILLGGISILIALL